MTAAYTRLDDGQWRCNRGCGCVYKKSKDPPSFACSCRGDLLTAVTERPKSETSGLAERAAALAGRPISHRQNRKVRQPKPEEFET